MGSQSRKTTVTNRGGFEMPTVVDYGTLVEMTNALANMGAEDGAGKQPDHHSAPLSP